MRHLFLLTVVCISSITTIGQISIGVSVSGPSSSSACDGSFSVSLSGVGQVNGTLPYSPGGANEFEIDQGSVSLQNLCADSLYFGGHQIVNSSCFRIYIATIRDSIPGALGPTYAVYEGQEAAFSIQLELPSSEFSGDGSITLSSTMLDLGLTKFFQSENVHNDVLLYESLQMNNPPIGTGDSLDGLNSGAYLVAAQDPQGYRYVIAVVLEPAQLTSCNDSILVAPVVTPASDNILCDGSVYVAAWGTVGPYSYEHSPIGSNQDQIENMCDGLYEVTVTDQADNSTTSPYIVPAFDNIVNSVNWPFDPSYDTLFSTAVSNCDLDFTQGIDSVLIDQVYLLDSVTSEVVWLFFQNGEVYSITHHYTYDGTSEYVITLGVYCENGRAAELGYYFAYDQFDFGQASQVGVAEMESSEKISIVPNPSTGVFSISCQDRIVGFAISDASGKQYQTIQNGPTDSIDLSGFSTGIYFVTVKTDKGVEYFRLVKN